MRITRRPSLLVDAAIGAVIVGVVAIGATTPAAAATTYNNYKNDKGSVTGAILHNADSAHRNLSGTVTVQPGQTKSFQHNFGAAGGVNVWLPKHCLVIVTMMDLGVPWGSSTHYNNTTNTGREQWLGSYEQDYFLSFSGTNRCQG